MEAIGTFAKDQIPPFINIADPKVKQFFDVKTFEIIIAHEILPTDMNFNKANTNLRVEFHLKFDH
jgi:hypothetical protein